MTRERDDEPRKAVRPTSQPGPTPDDVNDDPTEAGRLLDALHGVTWEGEPVSAVVERLITQAQRDALTDAADAWTHGEWADAPRRADRIQERIANGQHVGDWLRARAEGL